MKWINKWMRKGGTVTSAFNATICDLLCIPLLRGRLYSHLVAYNDVPATKSWVSHDVIHIDHVWLAMDSLPAERLLAYAIICASWFRQSVNVINTGGFVVTNLSDPAFNSKTLWSFFVISVSLSSVFSWIFLQQMWQFICPFSWSHPYCVLWTAMRVVPEQFSWYKVIRCNGVYINNIAALH
jgi:hypothetical protein